MTASAAEMDVEAPRASSRARLVTIAVTALVVVTAAWWGAVAVWGEAATNRAHELYAHRSLLQKVTEPPQVEAPLVAWVGDSTLVRNSYTSVLAPWLRKDFGADTRLIAYMGLSPYNFYELMGPVLALRPTVIVLVAHLRILYIDRGDLPRPPKVANFDDLASMIPLDELPRAMFLPWQLRGMSLARLVLLRLLRFEAVEQLALQAAGLQALAQEHGLWSLLIPAPPVDPAVRFATVVQVVPAWTRAYDVPLSRHQPFVRMLGAAVRMATRRHVRVLVVGSPIPWQAIQRQRGYDPAVYGQRFAILRDTVERNGGTFIDYHDVLTSEAFRDAGGHYNQVGAQALAARLRIPLSTALREELQRRPPRKVGESRGNETPALGAR